MVFDVRSLNDGTTTLCGKKSLTAYYFCQTFLC